MLMTKFEGGRQVIFVLALVLAAGVAWAIEACDRPANCDCPYFDQCAQAYMDHYRVYWYCCAENILCGWSFGREYQMSVIMSHEYPQGEGPHCWKLGTRQAESTGYCC